MPRQGLQHLKNRIVWCSLATACVKGEAWFISHYCLAGWVFWTQCGLGQMLMTVMSVFHQSTHIRSTKAINPECAAQNCKSKKDLLKPQISSQETSKNTTNLKEKNKNYRCLVSSPPPKRNLYRLLAWTSCTSRPGLSDQIHLLQSLQR